jgi:hypothetical protein
MYILVADVTTPILFFPKITLVTSSWQRRHAQELRQGARLGFKPTGHFWPVNTHYQHQEVLTYTAYNVLFSL